MDLLVFIRIGYTGGNTMNTEYILKKVRPYLNKNNEISSEEFNECFQMLTLQEQYQVIDILIENNIEYVDEKEFELKDTTRIIQPPITLKAKDIHLKNEQLCVMYQHGNTAALEMLLIRNEPFVYKTVLNVQKVYQHKLDLDDLIQEGKMGLIKAAQKFDVEKGFTFLTYAEDWIRQHVTRSIVNEGYTIRIPVHMFERISKIVKMERYCCIEDVRDRIAFLSEETGFSPGEVLECLRLKEQLFSLVMLSQFVGDDEDSELVTFIPDEQKGVDELVIDNLMADEIERVLETLTPREKKIIRLRFGLEDGRVYTLEEVGHVFDVTRERIRQIESKGLKKLRHPSRSKRLKDFL